MDLHVVPEEKVLSSHRYECDPWSEDESSFDVSYDRETFCQIVQSHFPRKNVNKEVKTKNELGFDDLPLAEELFIVLPKEDIMLIGRIHSIVQKLVIVHSEKMMTPIDVDSVLFIAPDKPLGRVFDVFGPLLEPYYCVRFNSIEEIKSKNINIGDNVFFAPKNNDITSYVLLDDLQKKKGSDASWKYNNEPPEECIYFSDDEMEKEAKHKRKCQFRQKQFWYNEVPVKRSNVKSSSDQVQAPVQQITTASFQPPLPNFHVQNQALLVEREQPFQNTYHGNTCLEGQIEQPFQQPQVPYLSAPVSFQSTRQFEAQVPRIQQLPVQQQISVAPACFSMATMAPSYVECNLPTQTPIQASGCHPFQMQVPLQQPQMPYIQASTSFEIHNVGVRQQFELPNLFHSQVPRMYHQAFSSFPGI